MRKNTLALILAATATFFGTSARAVPTELTGFGGWRFGGTFNDSTGQSHTAEPSGSWGGMLDIFYGPESAVEILVSRQETYVRADTPDPTRIDLTLDHYQIGGLKEFRGDRVRPFLAGLLGMTHLASGDESIDRFSVTMDGGVKAYLTPWLGMRGDLRCHLIFGNNNAVTASSGTGGGSISFAGEVFVQGEASVGVFLAFGGPRSAPDSARPLEEFHRRDSVLD